MPPAIEANNLRKRYGKTVALDGVSLTLDTGKVLAVLGPNGAGKSTTLKILTTLVEPDRGTARVAGLDVIRDAAAIRRKIGVTGQDATLDEALSGRENLTLIGELSRLTRSTSRQRAGELLAAFELEDSADRPVRTYSGGMRRRIDIAASLVADPAVLFLDEPTTGLDPASRLSMWNVIRRLVANGTSVLLTTQYLDEADELADRITVIDHGRVIADGTADELKAAAGADILELTLDDIVPAAATELAFLANGPVRSLDDGRRLQAPIEQRPGLINEVVRRLDTVGALVSLIEVHRPSLDAVFFALTTPTGANQ